MRKCGFHELENMGLQNPNNALSFGQNDSMSSQYWQACIFKVGDDVRQVGLLSRYSKRGHFNARVRFGSKKNKLRSKVAMYGLQGGELFCNINICRQIQIYNRSDYYLYMCMMSSKYVW